MVLQAPPALHQTVHARHSSQARNTIPTTPCPEFIYFTEDYDPDERRDERCKWSEKVVMHEQPAAAPKEKNLQPQVPAVPLLANPKCFAGKKIIFRFNLDLFE